MYTENEVLNNPSILLFDTTLPMELKLVGLSKKPNLLDAIPGEKTPEMIQTSFSNGYWNDLIKSNLNVLTDEHISLFFENADDMFVERFLDEYKTNLGPLATASLLKFKPNYYNVASIKKNDDTDWEVLRANEYMDEKTENPLLFVSEITQEKVNFLYEKFGKYALMNIPMQFQTEDMKEEILKNNPYDYVYVAFTPEIAKLFVNDYNGTIQFAMKKSKYDPFYDLRIIQILAVYGAALRYLDKQTEELQIIAIKNNPMAIEYAIKPSDTVCLTAVQLDADVIQVMENIPKNVCQYLNIPYVKPSKYNKNSKYLVSMTSLNKENCYRIYEGSKVDEILNTSCKDANLKKVKNIAKVKEITDDEIKVLDKFGLLKTVNTYFDETTTEK